MTCETFQDSRQPYAHPELSDTPPLLLDIAKNRDRQTAASIISSGKIIGFRIGTYGLAVQASPPERAHKLNILKERCPLMPLTLVLSENAMHQVFAAVDTARIKPEYQHIIRDPDGVISLTAGKCFLRLPLIPHSTILGNNLIPPINSYDSSGQPVVQIYHAGDNHKPGQAFIDLAEHKAGLVAVTSMNHRHQPTITDHQLAIDYCQQQGLPLLLDPTTLHANKSHGIIDLTIDNPDIKQRPSDTLGPIAQALLGLVREV